MADYYYTKGGERRGPIPEAELAAMIQSGSIEGTDYYWTQGMSDWELVSDATFGTAVATPMGSPEISPTSAPTVEPSAEQSTTAEPAFLETQPAVTESPFESPASTAITPSPAVAAATSPATSEPTAATSVFGTGSVISEAHTDTVFVKDVANALPKPLWLILPGVITILIGIPYLIFFFLGAIYIWIGVLLFQTNTGLENARRTGSARDLMKALGKINTLFVIVGVMTLISIVLVVLGLIFIIAGAGSGNF